MPKWCLQIVYTFKVSVIRNLVSTSARKIRLLEKTKNVVNTGMINIVIIHPKTEDKSKYTPKRFEIW